MKLLKITNQDFAGYEGKVFVIKYGGSAHVLSGIASSFAEDICLLKSHGVKVIIVHGGGRDISDMSAKLNVPVKFVNGLRYTDNAALDIVRMVLIGRINKDIVARINRLNGNGFGVSGIDGNLLKAKKLRNKVCDLGNVGEITGINTEIIDMLFSNDFIPVIAPVGIDDSQKPLNINADDAASAIACSLSAEKLIYLSDVAGVVENGTVIHRINSEKAEELIRNKVIVNGMIPKVKSALKSIESGVSSVHIIDGHVKNPLRNGIFGSKRNGTEIVRSAYGVLHNRHFHN